MTDPLRGGDYLSKSQTTSYQVNSQGRPPFAAHGESDGSAENGGLTPFSRECRIEDRQLTVKRKRLSVLSVPIFGERDFCHGLLDGVTL